MKFVLSVLCLTWICSFMSGYYVSVHFPLKAGKQVAGHSASKPTQKRVLASRGDQSEADLVLQRIMMISPKLRQKKCKPYVNSASIRKGGDQYYFEYVKKLPKGFSLKGC